MFVGALTTPVPAVVAPTSIVEHEAGQLPAKLTGPSWVGETLQLML